MFGCSETFHRNRGNEEPEALVAGGVCMYDAAQMRCTTRQKDVYLGRCGLTGLADSTCQERAVACGPDMDVEEGWKLPWHRREACDV